MRKYLKLLLDQAKRNAEKDPIDTLVGTLILILLGSVILFIAVVLFAICVQAIWWAFTNNPRVV